MHRYSNNISFLLCKYQKCKVRNILNYVSYILNSEKKIKIAFKVEIFIFIFFITLSDKLSIWVELLLQLGGTLTSTGWNSYFSGEGCCAPAPPLGYRLVLLHLMNSFKEFYTILEDKFRDSKVIFKFNINRCWWH